MSKYKLVAIDIDGTLLTKNGEITKDNIEAIKRCQQNGIKVCLCTGRNIKNTKNIAKQISNDMPFVCADGAVFYSTKENKVISEFLLSENTFEKIIREADNHNVYMEFCTKKYYIKYSKNPELSKYSYGKVSKSLKDRLTDYFVKNVRFVKNYEKFIEKNKNNVNQFIIAGEKTELDKMKAFFEKNSFEDIDVRYDLWEHYIFIVPKNCTKAYGLNIFSEYFGIEIEEMIAIGDQMNDIDMIKAAGLGVAMANAHSDIRAVANYITNCNEKSGVAHTINKFIFNEDK